MVDRRSVSFVLLAAALLTTTGGVRADAAEPVAPRFVVSSFDLGTVPQEKATAAELAAELNAAEWCTAEPKVAAWWNEVPAGVDPKQWLSVVTVGYGNRAEAYALMFDGPQGAARLIAHTPNPKGTLRGVPHWYAPFVKLLNGVRVGYTAEPAAAPRLEITLTEGAAPPPAPATSNRPTLDEALTVEPEKILPPLRAILLASACQAGWSAVLPAAPVPAAGSSSSAPSRAAVEVRVLDQACSFTVRFTHDGAESVVSKERIPWEEFHDQLTALFRLPLGDRRIHDFLRLGAGRVELLAAAGDRIAYLVDDELAALDATTGREAWRLRIPQSPSARTKRIEHYVVRRSESDGRSRLFRISGKPAEIAWADGAEQLVESVPAEPTGTIGGLNFTFTPDEKLTAVMAGSNAAAWQFPVGDRLLQPPQEFAGRVLVVSKQNRLVLLDPKSGAATAETTRPTWLVALEIVDYLGGPHLAVLDLDGGAALLDENLQTVWQARVPSRPTGKPAIVSMPAVFSRPAAPVGGDDLLTAIAADATKRQPFFLLTDADGFLYRLTLPEKK